LEADILASYWTMFSDQPEAHWRRALVRLASVAGVDMERELQRRSVKEVPAAFLRRAPFWEVLRTLLTRMGADPRFVDAVWEHGLRRFDEGVASGLANADGIYGYEYSSLASFQEAARRGLARIYEVPSPQHDFVQGLIQRELEKFPDLDSGKRAYFRARQAERSERRRQEWDLADVVIVNSTFTRETYAGAGFNVGKVRVVALGAPQVAVKGTQGGSEEGGPLRALWAGGFGIHKGAHYLLSAWKQIAKETPATLDIYGAVLLPNKLMRDLPSSIQIHSTIPRGELFKRYAAADVLVFPTLCDGFGMVVTEAFAHGLPVITTDQAGAVDLVRHGENGLVIPAADAVALREALEWCLTHRVELKSMRRAARETAANWQWSDFRTALAHSVIDGLREAGYSRAR
jgi:glycosyltransferase involved in cell wall biosynthesis